MPKPCRSEDEPAEPKKAAWISVQVNLTQAAVQRIVVSLLLGDAALDVVQVLHL